MAGQTVATTTVALAKGAGVSLQEKSMYVYAFVGLVFGLVLLVEGRKRRRMTGGTGGSKLIGLGQLAGLVGLAVGYADTANILGANAEDLAFLIPGYFALVLLALMLYSCAERLRGQADEPEGMAVD